VLVFDETFLKFQVEPLPVAIALIIVPDAKA
jgi:hypothetical protein